MEGSKSTWAKCPARWLSRRKTEWREGIRCCSGGFYSAVAASRWAALCGLTGISSGRAMAEPACLVRALHTEDNPIIFLYVSFYYDKVEAWF